MKLRRRITTWVAALLALALGLGGLGLTQAYAAAGDVPEHAKVLTQNDDGTYTIALNVKGDSEKKISKVNVIVIVDRSGSMDDPSGTGAYEPSNRNWPEMYGLVDGEYVQLERRSSGYGPWTTYTYWYNGTQYTGQRYIYDTNATRMAATQAAVNGLANTLLGYNGKDGNPGDTVEMALVSFSSSARTDISKTTSSSTFVSAVNNLNADGGTNWEAALQQANNVSFSDTDPTYVIFFSDGAPTMYGNNQGTGYEQEPNMSNSYNAATDDAAALAAKVGVERFYTIFAYGGNAGRNYMTSLTTAAGAPAENNYSASNTAELQEAFAEILESIETAGIGKVGISDGTTSSVTTTTGEISHLLTVDENSYKYYRAGGTADSGTGEKYDSTANGGLGEEWTDAPAATFENGAVKWNIEEILENDVTYTVTFDCWPSQETLDIVADLKNDPSSYDSLDANIQKYIDRNGNLQTNTTATLSYTDTRTGQSGSSTYDNPAPVQTTAVESLAVSKEWQNTVDGQQSAPIDLQVMRDGTYKYDVILSSDNDWEDSVYISIGIMRTDASGNYEVLETGHDFTFVEPEDIGYRWELDVPTVRPMLFDGELTTFIKVDEAHPAPAGAATYTIAGGTYYADDAETPSLTATNYRRSQLEVTKEVTGEGAPEGATYPFTMSVTNSKASEGAAGDTDTDYYVWFTTIDDAGQNTPDVEVTGATREAEGSAWFYVESGAKFTVNLPAGYKVLFINLPKDSTYSIEEGELETGYIFKGAELSGAEDESFEVADQTATGAIADWNGIYTVTYTNEYALVDVTATKVWDDASDQDGIRPESLELTLNGLPTGTTAPEPEIVKSEDGNTWTYTWKGVPKYDSDGNAITYTVTEKNVPEGYTCEVTTVENGGKITNAHTPEETAVKVTKAWEDANNQDGKRPESVTVQLKADGENYGEAVTLNATGNWTYTWEKLPVNRAGEAIAYTVEETPVPTGYTAAVTGEAATGYTITNSYTPEETELTVTKVWDDASDQDGVRPDSVAFTVTGSDGKTYDATLEGEGDTWTATIKDVAKYHDGGTEVTFTVDEADVANYTKSIDNSKLTITNSYTPEETEATIVKAWDDADNQDGKRPESISVQLYGNKKPVGEAIVLSADNDWTATVEHLPMNADGGNRIIYTWSEDVDLLPEGYELTSTTTEGTVTTLTNTHEPEKTSVSVAKTWSDADNQDGMRTDSVAVDLLANGEKANSTTLNAANEWKHTFEDLDVYANGEKIVYTVSENPVPEGYEATVSGDAATGYIVNNTHTPSTITISGTKTWDDANNQDGKRPETITVNLLADGTKVDSQVVSAPWTYSFADKPEFANGKKIDYTVTEEAVANYDGTITGYDIKNTHVLETVDIDVEKVWDDADNQDGKRPESITINLLADGVVVDSATVTPAEDGSWTCSFEGMPKYAAGEEGREVVYTVTEDEVEGYEATIDGYLVTNVHEPEKTSVTVSKTWDDADNQDGKRPASITINLLGDGELVTSASVTPAEDGTWSYTFENLTKYAVGEVGREVVYTITEDEVAEYDTAIDGFAVTNTHTPEQTEVSVTKVWEDADDQDGVRPDAITVTLLANGEQAATAELNADNEWSYTFAELDKFAAGKEISYTVAETQVEGYTSETTGIAAEGYTITNRHTPEVTDVPVTKVWDDADDQDGIRLANVVVKLLADGTDTGKTVTLNEANGWKATFTGVDKYAAGNEIAYTVAEDAPAGYQVAITGDAAAGYTVANSHTPELTEVKVAKVWSDADDQDGIRPADVTVRLLADGADTGKAVTLSADNEWTGTFAGLDKYAAGELVKYTVEEDPVADYAVAVAGDAAEGFTVTNSHTPGTTAVNVKKVWDDGSNHDGIRPASVTVELLADGEATGKTVTLDESNGWAGSFADLQKNAAGKAIKYTVEEKAVEGYAAKVTGSAADGFTVTNYHKVAEAVMIDPPVQKVIKVPVGTKPAAATFTFQMKAVTEGAPMPEGSVSGVKTMTIEGAGSKEFGEAWIDMPGTYVYELTEVKGDAKGYAYDTTVYTLTVEVTRNADGDLVKTETITDASGKKVEKVVFTNTFTPEPPVLPQTSDDSVPAGTLVVTALTGVALVAAGSALRLRRNEQ